MTRGRTERCNDCGIDLKPWESFACTDCEAEREG